MTVFPFSLLDGRIVMDETCRCGAFRSEHRDSPVIGMYGHGGCVRTGCAKFTWTSFVLETPRGHTFNVANYTTDELTRIWEEQTRGEGGDKMLARECHNEILLRETMRRDDEFTSAEHAEELRLEDLQAQLDHNLRFQP